MNRVLITLLFLALQTLQPLQTIECIGANKNKKIDESVISADQYFGRTIKHHFYDLKHIPGAIKNADIAKDLFITDRMNGLRIPIFGTDKAPAHPTSGAVEERYYRDLIRSINTAQAVVKESGGDKLLIFASKKLDGKTSFPSWVKGADGGVDPPKYGQLLVDFIMFMLDKGIEIDYLGVDNEYEYNEGKISAKKYIEIVDFVVAKSEELGFKRPQFVGAERYEPMGNKKQNWTRSLLSIDGGGDRMDIFGTHYYPEHRYYERLVYDMSLVGDREVWATEPHWKADSKIEDKLEYADKAICTLWDHTDLGVDCFIWWAYTRNKNYTGYIKQAISVPLRGSQPVRVSDPDGESIRREGQLQVRAFRNGDRVDLYIINVSQRMKRSYRGYVVTLDPDEGYTLDGDILARQWSGEYTPQGEYKSVKVLTDNQFSIDLPHRSITHIQMTLK